ncbi:MAG UNVERIFIED_CONTAM: hypothetical protein LVQ98_05205 [Rickettsiaceae bacterium]
MIIRSLKFLAFGFLLSFTNICMADKVTNIFIITDPNYVGDRNNLLGIANSTKRVFLESNQKTKVNEYNVKSLKRLRDKILHSKEKSIIIACSDYGIHAIGTLTGDNTTRERALFIHVSHQIIDTDKASHKSLVKSHEKASGADIIALPSHVLDQKNSKYLSSQYTKLVKTTGVAHNVMVDDIRKAYDKE